MAKNKLKEELVTQAPWQYIVRRKDSLYVLISHREIDYLIGNLMQMCDLTGDPEQRKALKDEIKQRTRRWLDSEYSLAGYRQHRLEDNARVVEIK